MAVEHAPLELPELPRGKVLPGGEVFSHPVVLWLSEEIEGQKAVVHAAAADRLIIELFPKRSIETARTKLKEKFGLELVLVDDVHLEPQTYVIQFRLDVHDYVFDKSAPALARKLSEEPDFKSVQPDYIYVNSKHVAERLPDDAFFGEDDWAFAAIQATAAWGVAAADQNIRTSTGSKDIRVAIIDTGIDLEHPDLGENLSKNSRDLGNDEDGNGFANDFHGWDAIREAGLGQGGPSDPDGHGTACAGIIGAVGNNEQEIAGVNWSVALIPIRAMNISDCGFSRDLVQAVRYAIERDVHIISISWGFSNMEDDKLRGVLEEAQAKGILVVAAAGNSGKNLDNEHNAVFPAAWPLDNILSVAATARPQPGVPERLALASNCGCRTVDLAAPGTDLVVLENGTIAGGFHGTSFSAAFVAGAAALAMAAFPGDDYKQIRARLLASVDQLESLKETTCSGGRINLHKLLSPSGPVSLPARCRTDEECPLPPTPCQS